MKDIYIGSASRSTREFRSSGTLTDLDALTVDIVTEAGDYLTTSAEGEFHDFDIILNKVSTGKYFTKITPDAAESTGIYLLYWTATYGVGAAAETFRVGPDVLYLHSEAATPTLSDNYFSLDALAKKYSKIFDLETSVRLLQIGHSVSRDIDSLLDERFNVPINTKSDGTYDQPLIDAAVALTIASVLGEKGYADEIEEWQERGEGIVESINLGRRRLSDEVTKDELGFGVPRPATANTSTNVDMEIHPDGLYNGDYHRVIIVKIDLAGAIGTATFKVSLNAGVTWEIEDVVTDEEWVAPGDCEGLTLRFFPRDDDATLALDDIWEIEAWPLRQPQAESLRGIRTKELRL